MTDIELGLLAHGPHANLIAAMATRCFADRTVQAIWVGGSLAAGDGDAFSDVDFRIAIEPGQMDRWVAPDWQQYLPLLPCGGSLMRFGEQALLHHLVLADGTIVDFYVQDTRRDNFEPHLVVLACRNDAFAARLNHFSRPTAALDTEVVAAEVRQFMVDYWIITHKEAKALARRYDLSPFVGLYWERLALLRAWYIEATGRDMRARPTLHMLRKLHQGLEGRLSREQQRLVGLPSQTPTETVAAIEALREEMARSGRRLAARYGFAYPDDLEDVVRRVWIEQKASIVVR